MLLNKVEYSSKDSDCRVDAFMNALYFYSIEALKVMIQGNIEFGMKSHEKLMDDVNEYQREIIEVTKERLLDYTSLACFGEMRHSKSKTYSNVFYKELKDIQSKKRESSYKYGLVYDRKTILLRANEIFNEYEWESGYGGKKWGFIADRVLLEEKMNDKEFCDMCFSLSHNGSHYLDKESSYIFYINNRKIYKQLLDDKFYLNPEIFFIKHYLLLGRRFRKLIKRANTLGLIKSIVLNEMLNNNKLFLAFITNGVLSSNSINPYYPNKEESNIYQEYELNKKIFFMTDEIEKNIMEYSPLIWGDKLFSKEIVDPNEGQEDFIDFSYNEDRKNDIISKDEIENNVIQDFKNGKFIILKPTLDVAKILKKNGINWSSGSEIKETGTESRMWSECNHITFIHSDGTINKKGIMYSITNNLNVKNISADDFVKMYEEEQSTKISNSDIKVNDYVIVSNKNSKHYEKVGKVTYFFKNTNKCYVKLNDNGEETKLSINSVILVRDNIMNHACEFFQWSSMEKDKILVGICKYNNINTTDMETFNNFGGHECNGNCKQGHGWHSDFSKLNKVFIHTTTSGYKKEFEASNGKALGRNLCEEISVVDSFADSIDGINKLVSDEYGIFGKLL